MWILTSVGSLPLSVTEIYFPYYLYFLSFFTMLTEYKFKQLPLLMKFVFLVYNSLYRKNIDEMLICWVFFSNYRFVTFSSLSTRFISTI